MPYHINQTIGGFEVVNTSTGQVHAKHTSRAKAQAQVRLLHAAERQRGRQPKRMRR